MTHELECPMASCLNEHPENFLYIPSCNCSCICDELRAAYQRGYADKEAEFELLLPLRDANIRADEREKERTAAGERAEAAVMRLSTAELLAFNFDDTREVRSMIARTVLAAAARGDGEQA